MRQWLAGVVDYVPFSCFVLLATVAATVFCGQARATPKARVLGTTITGVASDGARYVAFMPSEDVIRVFDMRSRSAYSLTTPCLPIDGAYGRFLLRCPDGYRLLQARTRRAYAVRVPERFQHTEFDEIGRYWLRGTELLDVFGDAHFLNWRNGSTASGDEETKADLERRGFHRKPSTLADEYFGSSGGLDLYCRERLHRRANDPPDLFTLELRRAGRFRPPVVLQRSRRDCPAGSARLRRGVAAWEHERYVYSYVLQTGHRYRWRGSDPEHTRGWIVFVRATGQSGGRVLYARLPGTGRP